MEKRILGRTGLEVSVLGLGGLFLSRYGATDQENFIRFREKEKPHVQ
jgi:aryl-alcohol dehydrogenase-like predicted oxidoreductase